MTGNQLGENQKKFVERTNNHRQEEAIKMANSLFPTFIKEDMPYSWVSYIMQRVKQIIELKLSKIDFSNEVIDLQRKEFLKKQLAKAKKIKVPLEELQDNKEESARQRRCETICQIIAQDLMEERLICSDEDYFTDAIRGDDELLLRFAITGYADSMYEKLLIGAAENERRANKLHWKGKEREEITWKDLDDRLNPHHKAQ